MSKYRPILFSDQMIRALLDGRKTVTRRVIGDNWWRRLDPDDDDDRKTATVPGDRLWVRESWSGDDCCGFAYRADHLDWTRFGEQPDSPWQPSIFMPKTACRIVLAISEIYIERLHNVTEDDARAEGMCVLEPVGCPCEGDNEEPGPHIPACRWGDPNIDPDPDIEPFRAAFRVGWDAINRRRAGGAYAWARNPWIWRIGFRPLAGDELAEALRELNRTDPTALSTACSFCGEPLAGKRA